MNIIDYDSIWSVECNINYLKYIGEIFEEITLYDNMFYYEMFVHTKPYLYINFKKNIFIETDNISIISQYISNSNNNNNDQQNTEIFTTNEIYSNRQYVVSPIKMLYETYLKYLPNIRYLLVNFYEWANIAIIKFSKIKQNLNFNDTIIKTKLNPYIFTGLYEIFPLTIFYENNYYEIDRQNEQIEIIQKKIELNF